MRMAGTARSVRSVLFLTLLAMLGGCPPTDDGQPPDLLRGPYDFILELPARTPPEPPAADKLAELTVDPQDIRFEFLGATRQLKVTGRYTAGRTADLTSRIAGTRYTALDEAVATAGRDGLVTAAGPGRTTIEVSNGGRTARISVVVELPEKPAERLDSLRVSPAMLVFARPGQTRRLEVSGTYSTGRVANLSPAKAGTTYQSDAPEVAAVDPDGLVTARGAGECVIAVRNGGRSAEVAVTVKQPPPPPPPDPVLIALRVLPADFTLTAAGATQTLAVFGDYSDGSERNLTADAATRYESGNPLVAEVSSAGVVTAIDNGVTAVRVEHGAFVAEATARVVIPAPDLVELTVTPQFIVFGDPGEKVQLRVRGRFSDGSERDVTDSAEGTAYALDDARIAAVTPFGEVAPMAGGSALLRVSNGAVAVQVPIDVQFCLPLTPDVDPTPPRTNSATVPLSGACEPGCTIEILGPGGTLSLAAPDGTFEADAPLAPNRVNDLFITALAPCGARSAPITVFITQDSSPPAVRIDFPPDGAELTGDAVDVSGRVSDVLSGYEGLEVQVNGLPAAVDVGIGTNGTFFLADLALPASGPLAIAVLARDALGNTGSDQIEVTRSAIPAGTPQMQILTGNGQSAAMMEWLPEPLRVRLYRADGVTPFAGKVVTFQVTRSDGRLALAPEGEGSLMCQARTDASGVAEVYWRVGGDAGVGNNRLEATSVDIAGRIFFCASAAAGPPKQINVGMGNFQRVETRGVAAEPLRVWVSDGCNGIAGVPVRFRASDGLVNGAPEVTVLTQATGHAEVRYTAGPEPGVQTVTAGFTGNMTGEAGFTVYSVRRDLDAPTTFVGEVRDNSGLPLGGAGLQLLIGGVEVGTAISGPDGDFEIIANDSTLGGAADLDVVTSTITTIAGAPVPPEVRFPHMHYKLTIVPNAVNRLMSEILLPRLQSVNDRVFSGGQAEDLELTCEGLEGVKFIVRAGTTVTLADGTVIGPDDPGQVTLAINQVHSDEIPMAMPDGAAPPFAWTFQPGGTRFDPPVQIELPNMSGLPVGSIVNFLSFDHDTNRFEIVAVGQAGQDGLLRSDPGSGIALSGWGANCPPYSVTGSIGKCGLSISGPSTVRVGAVATYTARQTLPKSITWTGGSAQGPRNQVSYRTIFTEPGEEVVGASSCGQSKFVAVTVLPDCDVELTDLYSTEGGCAGDEFVITASVNCTAAGRLEWSAPEGDPPAGVGPEFRTRFASYGVKDIHARYVRDDGIAAGSLSEVVEVRNGLQGAVPSIGSHSAGRILKTCLNTPVVLTPLMRCGELEPEALISWSCPTATPSNWSGPDYPVVFNAAGVNLVEVTYQPLDFDPQVVQLEVRIGECGGIVTESRLCDGVIAFRMEEQDIPLQTVEWFLPEGGGSPALFEGFEWEPQFCEPGDYPLVATITDECDNTCQEERIISITQADVCPIESVSVFADDQLGVVNPGAFFISVSAPCVLSGTGPVLEAPDAELLAEGPFGAGWLYHVRYCEPGDKPIRVTYDVPGCGSQHCTFEETITVTDENLCNVTLLADVGAINGAGGIFDFFIALGSTVIESAEIQVTPPGARWRLIDQDAVSATVQFCDPGTYEVGGVFTSRSCERECEADPVEVTVRAEQLCLLEELLAFEAVPGSGNWTFATSGAFPPGGRILWQVCNGPSQDLPAGEPAQFFLDPAAQPRYYVTATLTTEFCGNTCSQSIAVPDCGIGGQDYVVERSQSGTTRTYGTGLSTLGPIRWQVRDQTGLLSHDVTPNMGTGPEFTTQFCADGTYAIEAMLAEPGCTTNCIATLETQVFASACNLLDGIVQQTLSQTPEQMTVRFTLPTASTEGSVNWYVDGAVVGTTPNIHAPFEYTFTRGCDNELMTAVLASNCAGAQCQDVAVVETGLCQVGQIAVTELSRDASEINYRFTLPDAVGTGTVDWLVGRVIAATGVPVGQPFDYAMAVGCTPVEVRAELTVDGCEEVCSNTLQVTPCPDTPIARLFSVPNRMTLETQLCNLDGESGTVQWVVIVGQAEPMSGQSAFGPGLPIATFETYLCQSGAYEITATGPNGCSTRTSFSYEEDPGLFCSGALILEREEPAAETPTTRRLVVEFIEPPPADGSVQWYIDGVLRASLPSKLDSFEIDLNKGQTYAVRAVLTTPCGDMCEVNDVIVVQP